MNCFNVVDCFCNRQIEELTSHINKTEMKINDIEEENEELRFKLGMDPRDPLDLTEFRKNKELRKEEEKALNFILQKEVERLEDERIELKKKIRKLAQQTGQRSVVCRSRKGHWVKVAKVQRSKQFCKTKSTF